MKSARSRWQYDRQCPRKATSWTPPPKLETPPPFPIDPTPIPPAITAFGPVSNSSSEEELDDVREELAAFLSLPSLPSIIFLLLLSLELGAAEGDGTGDGEEGEDVEGPVVNFSDCRGKK